VVLIDAYDALLTPFIADPAKLEEISAALMEIFVCLETSANCIFKAFVTGGLKAGMGLVCFRVLITFIDCWILNLTIRLCLALQRRNLRVTYTSHIQEIFPDSSLEDSLGLMESYCNGYRFQPDQEVTLFNQFSSISYLHGGKLRRYWAYTCSSGAQLEHMLLRHGGDTSRGCRISWVSLQQPVDTNVLSPAGSPFCSSRAN
jgi:hypothetical protein